MSTTCVFCDRDDWLDVGVCAACSGSAQLAFVFIAPLAPPHDRRAAEEELRAVIGAELDHKSLSEVSSGRQSLALLPHGLAHRAVRRLDAAGLRARVVPRHAVYRVLPLSFVVMVIVIAMIGLIGGIRSVPMLLTTWPLVAATLLFAAFRHLRTPLLVTPVSHVLLPEPVRISLAAALAQLDDARARGLLLDIARMGEASFASLSEAFRAGALGESMIELLQEAGPLACEAAHLREIATELDVRVDGSTDPNAQQIDDAANARFALLEDVHSLLGRLARDGARSDGEVSRLLQLVRAEAARRIQAERDVAALLNSGQPAFR